MYECTVNKWQILFLTFSLSLCMIALTGMLLLVGNPAYAQSSTLYVAPDGDCGGASPCYATIQAAVDDASDGDAVKVAQGVYTGTGFQVVYISKAITVTGGYTITDWMNSDPQARPTEVDAEGVHGRRALYIDGTGVTTATIVGLRMLHGDSYGSGGGGIYIYNGTVILQNSQVISNADSLSLQRGGGIYIRQGNVTLIGNTLQGNRAWNGGAIFVNGGTTVLEDNTIVKNTAAYGCGLYAGGGSVNLSSNTIISNTNDPLFNKGGGGGVYLDDATATVANNIIENNKATFGAGVYVEGGVVALVGNIIKGNDAYASGGGGTWVHQGSVTIENNSFLGNIAAESGGGVRVSLGVVNLTDNSILGNTAGQQGGGIAVVGGTVHASNDMLANNESSWQGVYVSGGTLAARHWTLVSNGSYALSNSGGVVSLVNTIVATHTVAGFWGNNITAQSTLFFSTGTPCGGGASCANNVFGNPDFIDPTERNYHIGPGSAAVDQGVDAGITMDIDGEPRPMRYGYDIGADEQPPSPLASFCSSSPDWLSQATIFTNTTAVTGEVSYLWAFGDGASSSMVNPVHNYATCGVYTVVLTATNYGGSDVTTDTVTVYAAGFTSSDPDWLGQTSYFTDTTVTSGTAAYLWSFADGMTSTEQSPTHIYVTPGLYTVALTVTNDAGFGVATDTVTVYSPPLAAFTASGPHWLGQTTVYTNATIVMPTGNPSLSYEWAFGDGYTSTIEHPTHAYASPGVFTVALTATNPAGSDSVSDTVTVYSIPTVTFISSSPDWLGEDTQFTATLTTLPPGDSSIALEWDFGDGTTQPGSEHISHGYAASGSYTIALTATNLAGQDVATKTVIIHGPPVASFTTSTPDWLAQTTVFTNTTEGQEPITFIWLFGDGVTSTLECPAHLYGSPGLYTVTLTSTNPAGDDIHRDTMRIYGSPNTSFTAYPSQGVRPLTVWFTDTTTTVPPGDPTLTYLWRFGDGETNVSSNPSHSYDLRGVYTVTLTVGNAAGSDTLTRPHLISVYEPVQANFVVSPTSGIAPMEVEFTNQSTGDYANCIWKFGDGSGSSTCADPSHVYNGSGGFTVTLTVSGLGGSDTLTQTNCITAYTPVQASFTAWPTSGVVPLEVHFSNASAGDYTESLWNFGDGLTSTLRSPPHIYTTAGVYTVTLTVSGPGGSDTHLKVAYITASKMHTVYLPVILRHYP